MGEAAVLQPDTEFLRRVAASGGGHLKKCYQCATCSVACELAPDDSPFPRRQMMEAQWGLKDRLVADPALWLCHNCGKCTERCPRGARPGDVIGALRREAIRYFAFPRFVGALVANPKALPLLFLLPALIFAAVILWMPKPVPAPPFEFASLFPIAVLEPIFYAVSAFALLAFAAGVTRFARALRENRGRSGGWGPALAEIAVNRRFTTCGDSTMRTAHLLAMWGFVGLAMVGTAAGIGNMTGLLHTPMPLTNGIKIFANLCALAAL
ncbi:MAG TPA: 4Fe-4S dicluster domain-containing protein, partial [Candidatus Sulfopaludibacter sp.]|nr:4Fe-4S dicluster domain-containing protein [Candidatus Sulfopaludibacter sp.]